MVFAVFVIVVIGFIGGRVLPQHWRARRWTYIVIDIVLIIGAILIASRPIAEAFR